MDRAVALITGASGGIGRACALALSHSDAGFNLALHFQKNSAALVTLAAQLRRERNVQAELFQADLSVPGAAAAVVEQVAKKIGPPTVLIHAAGAGVMKPLTFTSAADWDAMLEVHALAAAALAKALLRYLRKTSQGRIVLIGSLAGAAGLGNGAAYAAAKGALHGLCKSLALETARWSTTVNVIAPGYVDTALTAGHDADMRAQLCRNIPLGRYGAPEEIAALAVFLCSPQAAYITGQTIVADGGMSLG